MRFYYGIDCVIIAKRKRCLLYNCMVRSGDTADVEGAVLHSPEPVKEYGLAIEMSRTSTLRGRGTLPSPTAGSRIWFPRPLLMLPNTRKQYGCSDVLLRVA